MPSSVKYVVLLVACAVAGILTGHLLYTPPSAAPSAAGTPVAASPVPVASSPSDHQAVTQLVQSLEKVAQPGIDSANVEDALLNGIEHFSSIQLAALANSLAGQTDNRLKNLTDLVIGYWAEKDVAAARDWVLKRPDRDAFTPAVALADTWAKKDATGFADWLAALSPEEMQASGKKLLGRFLSLAGPQFPDRALALVSSLRDVPERENAFSSFFAAWAKRDPARAAARVLQLETSASKAQSVESVAAAWAEKDSRAAWTWITSIPDAVLSLKAQQAFIDGLAKTDPAAAAQRVAELPLTQESTTLLKKLANEWSRKDPEAAAKWAAKIGDKTMREAVSENIQTGAVTSAEFEAATRFLIQHSAEMQPSSMALSMLMQRAARRYGTNIGDYVNRFPENYRVAAVLAAEHTVRATQPNFVEDWAMREPEGKVRSSLLAQVASAKHERDAAASVSWAKALPEGPSKHAAASVIINESYQNSPERSVEFLRVLTPPESLETRLEEHLRRWLYDVPKAARKWIESTEILTAAQKRAFLENQQP